MFRLFRYLIILLIVALCSLGLYVAWQVQKGGGDLLQTLFSLGNYVFARDNQARTFLVLFQNNWELRPGGGFIGSFGILKVKNGSITDLQIHDTGNFDGRIPSTIKPPYPMEETLHIDSWKLRDSNFSPDFATNAKQAEYFYHLGEGTEKFDGVFALTANVLTALLDITGPITLEGYPGTYQKEDGIYTLEYQVEMGYRDQGITKGERKSVMRELAKAIQKKLEPADALTKLRVAQSVLHSLQVKDIQLYFKDPNLQRLAAAQGWAGEIQPDGKKDYVMMVDANLGAYKSDYFVKRRAEYAVDLSRDVPSATLTIHYHHTAPKRDWLVNHYKTYLRVYVPQGSRLTTTQGLDNPTFSNEFGKTVMGFLVDVPVTQEKTISLTYDLPKEIKNGYDLRIQKQPGVHDVPLMITVIDTKGNRIERSVSLESDTILSSL